MSTKSVLELETKIGCIIIIRTNNNNIYCGIVDQCKCIEKVISI